MKIEFDYMGLANEVVAKGIHLADTFEDWTKLAMSLTELGEQGRSIFHQLASMSENYNQRESDYKFTNVCRTSRSVGVKSFVWLCKDRGIDVTKYKGSKSTCKTLFKPQKAVWNPQQSQEVSVIPTRLIERSRSNLNSLVRYLYGLFPTQKVQQVVDMYNIGSTRDDAVIYWQIDARGRCRTGKVMKYDAETGHRIKDERQPNKITWIHSLMIQKGMLDETWKEGFTQCLFGEHLLADDKNRGKVVAIVEAEKTALVASIVHPNFVWLACGGEMMFSENRLRVLRGRNVIAFPDAHPNGESYRKWSEVASKCKSCNIEVSDILEKGSSTLEKERKIDIADWLLENAFNERSKGRAIFARLLNANPCLEDLVSCLQLDLAEQYTR